MIVSLLNGQTAQKSVQHMIEHSTMARCKFFAIILYSWLLVFLPGGRAELLPQPLPDQPSVEADKPPLQDVLNGLSNATKSLVCAITDAKCGEYIVAV